MTFQRKLYTGQTRTVTDQLKSIVGIPTWASQLCFIHLLKAGKRARFNTLYRRKNQVLEITLWFWVYKVTEYYSAINKNKILPFFSQCQMDIKHSLKWNKTNHIISPTCRILFNSVNGYMDYQKWGRDKMGERDQKYKIPLIK